MVWDIHLDIFKVVQVPRAWWAVSALWQGLYGPWSAQDKHGAVQVGGDDGWLAGCCRRVDFSVLPVRAAVLESGWVRVCRSGPAQESDGVSGQLLRAQVVIHQVFGDGHRFRHGVGVLMQTQQDPGYKLLAEVGWWVGGDVHMRFAVPESTGNVLDWESGERCGS